MFTAIHSLNLLIPDSTMKNYKRTTAYFLITLLAAWFSVGCGKGDSPREVAESFLSSFGSGDYSRAKDYGTEETDRMMDMLIGFKKMSPDSSFEELKFEIVSERVEGDVATVMYKPSGSADQPAPLTLIQEDGKWLVSMNKESLNAGAGEALEIGGASKESGS